MSVKTELPIPRLSGNNDFVEFSTEIATQFGIEIAIILGFFKHHFYMSSLHEDCIPSYPTISHCCSVLRFWNEDKIRQLIAQLYTLKLI
jgi:hypothetical protein